MDCIICGSWFSSTIHDGACPDCSRAIKRLGLDMTPTRLLELARAKQDGRLVVLPPNDPLTLEELREMDGEPVWVRNHCTGDYICRVINSSDEHFTLFTDGDLHENRSYGSYWTAYRRRPEKCLSAPADPAVPGWAEHLNSRFLRTE